MINEYLIFAKFIAKWHILRERGVYYLPVQQGIADTRNVNISLTKDSLVISDRDNGVNGKFLSHHLKRKKIPVRLSGRSTIL